MTNAIHIDEFRNTLRRDGITYRYRYGRETNSKIGGVYSVTFTYDTDNTGGTTDEFDILLFFAEIINGYVDELDYFRSQINIGNANPNMTYTGEET